MASDGEAIDDLIAAYEQTALRWADLQSNASAANKVLEENQSIYKRLRDHPAGREGIASLMTHDSEWVRLAAATHSLAWAPETATATATLEAIEHSDGLIAVNAKWTLRSSRNGTLDLDYERSRAARTHQRSGGASWGLRPTAIKTAQAV